MRRHTSIVNSSGTGKSRAVDQVAMDVITVPMCLRDDGSQGATFGSLLSFSMGLESDSEQGSLLLMWLCVVG
jgi:hypothetical protein